MATGVKWVKMPREGKNARSYLNELMQKNGLPKLEYKEDISCPAGQFRYRLKLNLPGRGIISCSGDGTSKQLAATACAEQAIKKLENMNLVDRGHAFDVRMGAYPNAPPQTPRTVASLLSASAQWVKMPREGKNARSYLKELMEKNGFPKLEYEEDASCPAGEFRYRLKLHLPGKGIIKCSGDGSSKQLAATACAEQAIKKMENMGLVDRGHALNARMGTVSDAPPQILGTEESRLSTSAQWLKIPRGGKDAKSYLNELLPKNGIRLKYEEDIPVSLGQRQYRLEFHLPGFGIITCTGDGPSKQLATTACAELAIKELQNMGFIDQDPASGERQGVIRALPQSPRTVASCMPSSPPITQPAGAKELEFGSLTLASQPAVLRGREMEELCARVPPSTVKRNMSVNIFGPVYMQSTRSESTSFSSASSRQPAELSEGEKERPPELRALFENADMVTDRDILVISKKIGHNRKTIALELGLTSSEVENCEYREDDPQEVNRKIIRRWRENKSREATVAAICNVLWKNQAYDAVWALGRRRGLSE